MAVKHLGPNAGMTEEAYRTYADGVHYLEAKGGVCQLALKVFKLKDGTVGMSFPWQTPTAQDSANLRAALAEIIAQIR